MPPPPWPTPGVRAIVVRAEGPLPDGAVHFDEVVDTSQPMPDVEVGADDDATILYTSGTTGRPKGAVSTHRAVTQALTGFACRAAVQGLRDAGRAKPEHPPAFILCVPLFHVTGCVPVMMSTFAAGLKLVIMYKWDPELALEHIEAERITNFVGVPTMSWDLLESPDFERRDTSSLVSVGGGGAPAPPELVKRVESGFAKGRPAIGYGMTETNAYGPQNTGDDYVSHPTSTGRGTPILEIKVIDGEGNDLPAGELGEICFKGPHLIRGYWNRPDATAETIVDGWLRSGDIGRIDEDGFVYVTDRAKDMILRGGENIYCAEVEAVVYEHPRSTRPPSTGCPTTASARRSPSRCTRSRARPSMPTSCAASSASGSRASRCPRSCTSHPHSSLATRAARSSSGSCATRRSMLGRPDPWTHPRP